jgi:hypothetical protein
MWDSPAAGGIPACHFVRLPEKAGWKWGPHKERSRSLVVVLSYPGIHITELTPEIAIESTQLPGEFHRDPADQITVATARLCDCLLVTSDSKILKYPMSTLWLREGIPFLFRAFPFCLRTSNPPRHVQCRSILPYREISTQKTQVLGRFNEQRVGRSIMVCFPLKPIDPR